MKIQKNEGITLIALVITIIVLLILAGVSIAMLTGNNGILTQASTAKNTTALAEEEEKIKLAYENYKIKKSSGNTEANLTMDDSSLATVKDNAKGGWIITFNKSKNSYSLGTDGVIAPYKLDPISAITFKVQDYQMTSILNQNKGKSINLNDYINVTPKEHSGNVIWELAAKDSAGIFGGDPSSFENKFDKYSLDSTTGILTIPTDVEMVTEKKANEDVVNNPWGSYKNYYLKCYSSDNNEVKAMIYVGYSAK